MKKIKVLVVDDSAFMRKIVSDIVNDSPDMEVIDTARNGKKALELMEALKPDVVTMDIEMPILDGLSALKIAMEKHPLPIIMLSSLTKEGAESTFKALEYGAVDFIAKPSSVFKVNTDDVKENLLEKIRIASSVTSFSSKPASNVSVNRVLTAQNIDHRKRPSKSRGSVNKIVAIGTSTGGPKALQSVIPLLSSDIKAPVLIVQHMPPGFTKSLAERLDSISQISVKEAEDGDVLEDGCCYIAPGDRHLKVVKEGNKYFIRLDNGPLVTGHKPSADAMFYSLSALNASNVIGVIMTGMGSDGAKGLAELKALNNYIIAQDEASCVVYGMPKSAVNLNAVDKVLPLEQLSNAIMRALEE